MNKSKKINANNLLMLFIIMQPIIDIITSIIVRNISPKLTVGIVVRTIFMVVIVLYTFFNSNKKQKIIMMVYYGIIFVYSILFLLIMYKANGTNMIMAQIKGLFKTFYLPIIIVSLYILIKNKKIEIKDNTFIYALLGYTLTIFLARLFNVAYSTYSYGSNVGTTGLFYSANEIGTVISILSVFLFSNFFLKRIDSIKHKIIYIISLFLYMYSVLEMGTKVPVIGFICVTILIALICIIRFFTVEKKFYLIKFIELILLVVVVGICLPYTCTGKNIEQNYGIKFFKIYENDNNINNKNIDNKTGNKKTPQKNHEKKFKNTEELTTAIVSSRNLLLSTNLNLLKDSPTMNKIVGIGYVDNSNGQYEDIKTVEMDYFDIAILQGIFGAIIFFIPIVILSFCILKKSLFNIKKIIKNEDVLAMYIVLSLAAAIAMLAGHTLVAPAVSMYIAFILNKLFNVVEETEK